MARLKGEKEEITGNLDPRYWVQKSDPLVLMRSVPFTLGELKILDTYISRINAADDTRRTVIFTKEEYEELMGLTCADYRTLKKNTSGMLGKVVTLEMPNKEYVQFVLFEGARYRKDEYGIPIIELTCSTLAKDLFFCVGKYHYFKYALENVISLTRKASYLLYVYIRANRYRGKWDIDLNELRDTVLDCKGQESYLAFKEFKRAVLDPAVKEVNKKTDCHFEYETVKRGRRVVKIKFIYHRIEKLDNETVEQLVFADIEKAGEMTDEQLEEVYGNEYNIMLAQATNCEFSREQIELIGDLLTHIDIDKDPLTGDINWGREQYLRTMYLKLNEIAARMTMQDKPIKNRCNYLTAMLKKEIKPNG